MSLYFDFNNAYLLIFISLWKTVKILFIKIKIDAFTCNNVITFIPRFIYIRVLSSIKNSFYVSFLDTFKVNFSLVKAFRKLFMYKQNHNLWNYILNVLQIMFVEINHRKIAVIKRSKLLHLYNIVKMYHVTVNSYTVKLYTF